MEIQVPREPGPWPVADRARGDVSTKQRRLDKQRDRDRAHSPGRLFYSSSLQHRLNQPLILRPNRPKFDNLQSDGAQKFLPLRLRSLYSRKHDHHEDVQCGRIQGHIGVGQDPFVDQKLGVSWRHCLDYLLEDSAAFVVGPVVEDGPVVVGSCTWRRKINEDFALRREKRSRGKRSILLTLDRLRSEEVVLHLQYPFV